MTADGYVIINTKIDTSGFKQGETDAQKAFSGIGQKAKQLGDTIRSAFSGTGASNISKPVKDQSEEVLQILSNTEKSATAKAAQIAAVYKRQGLNQSDAFKKAWEQIERSSSNGSKKIKKHLSEIGEKGKRTGKELQSGLVGGIGSAVKKIGALVGGLALGRALVEFGKDSSAAAREAADSLTGLQSILEGQGRSFSDAKSFIDDYVQDGLIPMADATTAYKNLASRGYDDSQIQQVMVALKDASAYGRQASLSMGDAVKSATEGLKNENSVLVDNAGVTKNVAKMWEDYARSIGTTANNLTQQQKIQAEVSGILEETKFQTGDAAKVAGTLTGKLQQLSFGFNNLKVAVGNIINPFLNAFLPVINAAISAVTRFANAIATLVNDFFGTSMNMMGDSSGSVANAYEESAESAENLASATTDAANATKKAQKANKMYLSGLDEIKKFTSEDASATTAGGTATPSVSGVGSAISNEIGKISNTGSTMNQITSKFAEFTQKIKSYLEPLTVQIKRFSDIASSAFKWFFDNVLKPLATWVVNEYLPRWFEWLAAIMSVVNNVLIALQPLWSWFWNNVLAPIASWTGGIFLQVWDLINKALKAFADWCAANPAVIQTIATVIASFFAAFLIVGLASKILTIVSALGEFVGVAKTMITTLGLGGTASKLFGTAISALKSPFGIAVTVIGLLISAGVLLYQNWDVIKEKAGQLRDWIVKKSTEIKDKAVKAFEELREKVSNACEKLWDNVQKIWDWIRKKLGIFTTWLSGVFEKDWTDTFGVLGEGLNVLFDVAEECIEGIKEIMAGLIKFVTGIFTGDWEKAWEGVKEIFGGIWETLVDVLKSPINGVIRLLNQAINKINNAIAGIESAFSFGPWEIPTPFGSKTIGFSADFPRISRIPLLAKGAVIPPNAPFMAMLGDQKRGTNIEAPLSTIEEALENVLAKKEITGGNSGGSWRFTAQINGRTLFDEMLNEAKMRQMRTGRNPFELA